MTRFPPTVSRERVLQVPSTTSEYVHVDCSLNDGTKPADSYPTIDLAVLPKGQAPEDEDWSAADYMGSTHAPYLARQLVSLGQRGRFTVWFRLNSADDVEHVVREAGDLNYT